MDSSKLENARRDIVKKKKLTDIEIQMIKDKVSEELGILNQNHQENA